MGVAAHDANSFGIIGTMHKARDMIRHTEKAAVDRKGCEVGLAIDNKSGDLTRDKSSLDSNSSRPVSVEATPIQIFHIRSGSRVADNVHRVDALFFFKFCVGCGLKL
jgi:hypothetical protein